MDIELVNQLSDNDIRDKLYHCLSCHHWVENMMALRPFLNREQLQDGAQRLFQELNEAQLLEAFDGHPKIGDVNSLKAKYAATRSMAGHEQSTVSLASDDILNELAKGNQDYQDRFGFIFIVFATGKSAAEMLALLNARLPNTRDEEIANAATEQQKITMLRLEKVL